MARPLKQGLDYFPLDTDFLSDRKVRKIINACGPNSVTILICLLCNIYKDKGYYIPWDNDLPFVVADSVGTTEGAVIEVVKKAIQVDFFNEELFNKHNILTSNGIQRRFKSAVSRREKIEYVVKYWVSDINNEVIDDKNGIIDDKNGIIDDISTQSKEKVKKKRNRNTNTPQPPLKGEGRKGDNESKKINSKARFLFEEHFKHTFSSNYYWTAKDAGAMSQLLQKITFSREQKGMLIDDDSILYALRVFLLSIKDGWIFNHFSVTNINSQFNEIVATAQGRANKVASGKLSKTDQMLIDAQQLLNDE